MFGTLAAGALAVNTTLDLINRIINVFQKGKEVGDKYINDTDIISVTKPLRVEPITLISKDCMQVEYLDSVINVALNIFTAYYLQAFALLTSVKDVNIIKTLNVLNPDRDILSEVTESAVIHDPKLKKFNKCFNAGYTLVEENYKYSLPTSFKRIELAQEDRPDPNAISSVNENKSLAVGKLINVTATLPTGKTITLPINIKLITNIIQTSTMIKLMMADTDLDSFSERWYSWKAGRISFIKDLILCADLIKEHKKLLMSDDSKVYSEIKKRVANNRAASIISDNVSLATASNILIITDEVVSVLEERLGGKITSPYIRNQVFEGTAAMIVIVINRKFDRVSFYYKDVDVATDVSRKGLERAAKNQTDNIVDILKAFTDKSSSNLASII